MSDDVEPVEAQNYVPVCSIGASAGGVTALQGLFRQLPSNLGLAYVVILHLSPEHPSAMSDILAGCTRMPVLEIDDGPTLKPDCVYVIPPDRELIIQGDSVTARPFSEPRGQRAPIDMFFRSVAAARGDGVAIVLSGAGADGTLGIQAIKEAGGVILVQEPAEAGFPSMPQNAIASGVADFVAPLARLAERLAEVAHSKEAVRSLDMDGSANDLRRIVAFLRARTGHDFSSYKRATVMRRVLRRMQVCRRDTVAAYADYLSTTPEEAKELFADLLISVTMFFRDPRAYEALERHAIKPLFDDLDPEKDEGIRAWVVGCASGEEAYSIAMLLHEEAARRKTHTRFQIFASDLDEGALATAREGRYPRSIEADVSEERLARFFIDEGTHYRVRKELRESVLFATHSVLKEPPFMRLDLITCRNLLIYMERALQQQICSIFRYGLKPGRFLFLGSAETADAASDLFAPLDRDARIYSARPHAAHTLPILPQFTAPERFIGPDQPPLNRTERSNVPVSLHASALERSAPASAIVDSVHNIVHLSPSAGRFILHSAGPISNQLPAIVRPELRLDLRLALTRALDGKKATLTHPTILVMDGERRRVSMHVAPVPNGEHMGAQALVFFLDDDNVPDDEDTDISPDARPDEVRRLHAELKAAQEAVAVSRAGHEVSIQDLRATNEELQSINEEYRSTAEELETSKEELQSINEELHTVNAELKSKLTSISVAHSDLQNLTDATEIGTLFLDAELRIKMFTPPITDFFNVTKADIGRTITDFSHRLDYEGIDDDARRVLRDLAPVEREVHSRARCSYVMRMRPYRTIEDRIDGVVVTFFDITDRLEAEVALAQSELKYRTIFDSIDEGFCVVEMILDEDGKPIDLLHLEANQAYERYTGLHDIVGKRALEIVPEGGPWIDFYGSVALTGRAARNESYLVAPIDRWIASYASRIGDEGSLRVAIVFNDITERKRAEETLRNSEERQAFLLKLSDALRPVSDPLEIQDVAARILGEHLDADRTYYAVVKGDYEVAIIEREYRPGDAPSIVGTHPFATFGSAFDDFRNGRTMAVDDLEATDRIRSEDLPGFRALSIRSLINTPLVKAGRSVAGMTVLKATPHRWTAQQVSLVEEVAERTWAAVERARAEAAMRESEAQRRVALEGGRMGTWRWDLANRLIWGDARFLAFWGFPPSDEPHPLEIFTERMSPEGAAEMEVIVTKAIAAGEEFDGQLAVVSGPTAGQWIRWRGRADRSTPSALYGITFDITDQRRAETLLRESEERYRTMFETMDEGYLLADVIFDEAGKAVDIAYVNANPAAIRMVGTDLTGRRLREVADYEEYWYEIWGRVARTGEPEHLERYAAPDGIWYDFNVFKSEPDNVDSRRVGVLFKDVTRRRLVEQALRESEERQAFLLKLSDDLRPLSDPSEIQAGAMRVLGQHLGALRAQYYEVEADDEQVRLGGGYAEHQEEMVTDRILIDDFGLYVKADFRQGSTVVVSNTATDPRVSEKDARSYEVYGMGAYVAVPLVKAGRFIVCIGVHNASPRDWTSLEVSLIEETAERTWAAVERARAETRLRESEERFAQFAAASSGGLWVRDAASLSMEYVSPAIGTIYGVAPEAILGEVEKWAAIIVPDDRDIALEHLASAQRGEAVVHEFRIQRPSDHAFRWIRNTDFPLGGNGQMRRIGGIAEDVTEAKLAVEHQAVLLAELQHRVRNIMAVIRAITARTAERAESVQSYGDLMMGRLLALARVQALLTHAANVSVGIRGIVLEEVSVQAQHEGQYVLDGPDVALSPKAAEVMTLAIHELATNALKYGALSVPHGRVTVKWATFEKRGTTWLGFDWTEEGAPERPQPAPDVPRRRGFGSELIEGRVPYELKGTGRVTIEPGGARCRLEFPLRDGASILETDAPQRASVFGGAIDMTGEADLSGRCILVVEDDYYLATDTARALQGAGAQVLGPVSTEADARDALEEQRPDAVVVDINFGSGPSFKFAEYLKDSGIPFVFTTGYDPEVIPAEFERIERLQKPVQLRQIIGAVSKLL